MTRPAKSDDDGALLFPSDNIEPIVRPPKVAWDDDEPDPEGSTYALAEHGPEPVPDWVLVSDAARQRDVGPLKGGKEADVFLVERWLGDRTNHLAAKRYRGLRERGFRNDARYRQSRRTGDRRIDRAASAGTRKGLAFRTELWASHEFEVLGRLWEAGAPVPYPVQRLGLEMMIELVGDEAQPAPRLIDAQLDPGALESLREQAIDAIRTMTRCGIVHADLSPYNVLVHDGRLYLIDFPQAVAPQDPDGLALLRRDVVNLLGWLDRRGARCDPEAVFADLVAEAFG